MVVNVCGIHLVLPHQHTLSPGFMDGIYHSWPGSVSTHLLVVQIFSALAVSMAMSAHHIVAARSSQAMNVFPPNPEPYQRVALCMLPVISVLVAAMSWGVLMGSETLMWPTFFGRIFGEGVTPLAGWSVWLVAFYASAATAAVLFNYHVQPQSGELPDQS